ncbi:MAG: hypothetical protein F6K48_34680, partial [Okeania sp. SIO3H1]|nr:hypothetical protein [Okeania sp. SIO3H1]
MILSDSGTVDGYVGAMKGVIHHIVDSVQIED